MTKRIYEQKIIEPQDFDKLIKKLRGFFMEKGYLETFPQPRLSILAACEDPKTVRSFNFAGDVWPLGQTNQVWLEFDLLKNYKEIDGVYCLTTSYRDEPNPIEGRHEKIFGMFEAEHKGDFNHLLDTLKNVCVYLGLVENIEDIPIYTYQYLCNHYNVDVLESEHETLIWKEFGDVVGITKFPQRTSPFWNMQHDGICEITGEQLYNKCDLIICGQETFGSAERSSNPDQMRKNFHTISDGMYAKLLYNSFSEDRVEQELEDYLSLEMNPRWGFGMGIGRLLRAMKIKGLI
jgi:aspartyl/asparaginyl-tRNA synthetase